MILNDPLLPDYPCVEGGGRHPCDTVERCERTSRTLEICRLCEGRFVRDPGGEFVIVSGWKHGKA